jgi:nucleolar protein 58
MGTEITEEDLENIKLLAEQVISYSEYRRQLSEYLENRMKAISPNMTELVGALVGARLIAHAGSLISLAKNPGSTIQILGAEKALFRALKTKHATPKYGLIYHASLVGQASGANKGKMARQLASKVALGVRTDALGEFEDDADDETRANLGIRARAKLENNLRVLEGKPLSKGVAVDPNGMPLGAATKWDIKEARKYNIDADGLSAEAEAPKRPLIEEVDQEMAELDVAADSDSEMEDAPKKDKKKEKKEKKDKSKKAKEAEAPVPAKITEKDYERLAEKAGISVSKFAKKFEKGLITVNADGTVEVLSKKDSKAQEAEEEVAETPVKAKSSKRQREPEVETPVKEEKPKKKKKKSSKE